MDPERGGALVGQLLAVLAFLVGARYAGNYLSRMFSTYCRRRRPQSGDPSVTSTPAQIGDQGGPPPA